MRVTVVAVGRAQDDHLNALWERYATRLKPKPALRLVEDKRRGPGGREREAALILAQIPDGATVVALDERGKVLDSAAFARQLGRWRADGRDLVFVIGGADGLDDGVTARAALTLSLGAMTWPHQLVRVLLIEQLYRADTILSGHPYHRA
jgi:23S rRNA (pseudouridine1915-N3)-methyltransferase